MSMQNAQYGESLLTRKSEISQKLKTSNTNFPLEVMGKYQPLKQIRVRIGLLVYRIENGRTRTFQREYLATHPDAPIDLFSSDNDSIATQRAQHSILKKLAADEDLLKEFQSGTQQTEPVIITNTGVVVNGNRRLCVWRTLYYSEPEKYKSFQFIDCAVLPDDCDETEIRNLEKRLQIQKSHRAAYKWHNKAAMLKEEREAGATTEALAKSYDISKKEVDLLIGALEYADTYLKKIGKNDQWSLVDGEEFAFKAMVDERKKITDQGKKELFEAVCFKLIEKNDYQGNLHHVIPEIAQNLEVIASTVLEKKLIPPVESTSVDVAESSEDIDLLGGGSTKKDSFSEIATAIQSSAIKLGGVVKQVTEEQKAIKAEQKSNKYLINTLAKINSLLMSVKSAGLNEATLTDGVKTQISAIRENLDEIEKWIDK